MKDNKEYRHNKELLLNVGVPFFVSQALPYKLIIKPKHQLFILIGIVI